jgi:hypothetical protein
MIPNFRSVDGDLGKVLSHICYSQSELFILIVPTRRDRGRDKHLRVVERKRHGYGRNGSIIVF